MDSLHAPWRIEYILGPKAPFSDQSIFTKIWQSGDDIANHVIARGRSCFALLNTYPYTGGHCLVVPYKETPDLHGLTDEELLEFMSMTRKCQTALTNIMRPDGFNMGINLGKVAGAGIIEHVHLHIVPRWNGDTNFMPVLAGTTVLPEALLDVAAKLRAELKRLTA